MSELTALTIAEARDKLKAKAFTASELTEAYIAAIESANDKLNAYVAVTPEKAREMAKLLMPALPKARLVLSKVFHLA